MSCGLSESGLAVIISSIFIGTGSIIGISKRDVIKCKCCCLSCDQNVRPNNTSPNEPQEPGFQTARVRDSGKEIDKQINVFNRAKSTFNKIQKKERAINARNNSYP